MKKALKTLWKDESAQGATEYILLLVVIVGMVFLFKGKIEQLMGKQVENLEGKIQKFN